MAAMTIRNIPDDVHDALRLLAAERRQPIEAFVRDALSDIAKRSRSGGIDFVKLARDRAALGLHEDGPAWDPSLDEPALSRRVLGLKSRKRKK